VSGLFEDIDDVREHGKDERIGVREFQDGRDFLYQLVRMLTGDRDTSPRSTRRS
jgi:hypothetical protein